MKSDGDLRDGEDADCHSQCAHWLRNDSFFKEMRWDGPMAPTDGCKKCLHAGRCGHRPLQTVYR